MVALTCSTSGLVMTRLKGQNLEQDITAKDRKVIILSENRYSAIFNLPERKLPEAYMSLHNVGVFQMQYIFNYNSSDPYILLQPIPVLTLEPQTYNIYKIAVYTLYPLHFEFLKWDKTIKVAVRKN